MRIMNNVLSLLAALIISPVVAGALPTSLQNGSFESPQNTMFYDIHQPIETGVVWKALSVDGAVEFGSIYEEYCSESRSAYGVTRAQDGFQFAELCANAAGALYQLVETVPGKTYHWSYYRKARVESESSALWVLSPEKFEEAKSLYLQYLRGERSMSEVRQAGQDLTNENFVCYHIDLTPSGDTTTWTRFDGTYTVPAGQTNTYVVLASWAENPEESRGYLVDNVSFAEEPAMTRGIVEISNVKGGVASVVIGGELPPLKVGSYTGIVETNHTISITVQAATGYTFLGALVTESTTGGSVAQGEKFVPAAELVNYPLHEGMQRFALAYGSDRTVSYLPNNGTFKYEETKLAKTAGSNYIPETPKRKGFVFTGWRERTSGKILMSNKPVFWANDELCVKAVDETMITVPAEDGMQLLATWTLNLDWIPSANISFYDGSEKLGSVWLNRNDSMYAKSNPMPTRMDGFTEYEIVGWREPTFNAVLSTNITAFYVGETNAVSGATDGVIRFMDADGGRLSLTNYPGVTFKARWAEKCTYEWSVVHTTKVAVLTNFFHTLSEALAVLADGDTLKARPPAEGYGLSMGLKPDTNDVIIVDCPFAISKDNVTIDLNGRVLNSTVSGTAGEYLLTVDGVKGVTIRNGYIFGVKDAFDGHNLGPQAYRAIKADKGAELVVERAVLYYHPYTEAVLVDNGSTVNFRYCHLDGEGDGAEGVVCARNGSVLQLLDCRGVWNVNNFWNNSILNDSLDNVTGEQFLLEDSKLVLDNTVISNSYSQTGDPLPYIVTTCGNSEIALLNSAGIREGLPYSTLGAIYVDSGTCKVGNGDEDGLRLADGFVIGRLVKNADATLIAGAANYAVDPTDYLGVNGNVYKHTTQGGVDFWRVFETSGNSHIDRFQYHVIASGIENIHVNKFVPYEDPVNASFLAGNMSIWMKMSEDGLAKKIYLDQHNYAMEVGIDTLVTNAMLDVLFPTNTVAAHVWRGRGEALTNLYGVISTDVAKTIFDPEILNLLTNFSPIVNSITRGVGSATIPYVDGDGNQQLGKAVVMGCAPGDWTAYEILVAELKRLGDGYEDSPSAGVRRFVLTNSTVEVLGSRMPSVAFGPLGYVVLCSSKGVDDVISVVVDEFMETGKHPFYDGVRKIAVSCDAEMRSLDPEYVRDFKTEGFERFGYACINGEFSKTLAQVAAQFGIDPTFISTNLNFRYLATLCSEECTVENDRMRIDVQGSGAFLRLLGATMRISNLFLVNAGMIDEDYVTFAEEWQFDREMLEKLSVWADGVRERLGLNGTEFSFEYKNNAIATYASVGMTSDGMFRRLFCAGKAGADWATNPCEIYLPSNTIAGFSFQPEAAAWVELNQRLFSLLGVQNSTIDTMLSAIANHPDSFGKSAAIGVTLGSSISAYGSSGQLSRALDFISIAKIEDENLWGSIRILLEQRGWKAIVSTIWPEITVCVSADYKYSISYDRENKIIVIASSIEAGKVATAASRDEYARLVSPYNSLFNSRMGIKEGEVLPAHNVLYYIDQKTDTVFLNSIGDLLEAIGLGALRTLIQIDKLPKPWLCGWGAYNDDGRFRMSGYASNGDFQNVQWIMQASAKTFGQVMAAAYPYDASQARVFTSGDMTFHVSRADNWDDINHCLYPYEGNNIRIRAIYSSADYFNELFYEARLDEDGKLTIAKGDRFLNTYMTSQGIFGNYSADYIGNFVACPMPEVDAELSVLPSAEEIAAELAKVKDSFGIESILVGTADSDGRTGPLGEPTVVRTTTVTPVSGGGLDTLLTSIRSGKAMPMSNYMPSNTVCGISLRSDVGTITNLFAAIKYAQPELAELIEKQFFNTDGTSKTQMIAGGRGGLTVGFAKCETGTEFYYAWALERGHSDNWDAITNRIHNTPGLTVTESSSSSTPGEWAGICYKSVSPITKKEQSTCMVRVFESADREPVLILTKSDSLLSSAAAAVVNAGVYGIGRLVDDATYKACEIPVGESEPVFGMLYVAPIYKDFWLFDKFVATDDGKFVIQRRCSAAKAPLLVTTFRLFVNFIEALTGEKTVVEFEDNAEDNKYAEAATARAMQFIENVRKEQGITGLDYYNDGLDEAGCYGRSELAIGTTGDGCAFFKRYAASEPISSPLVEQFIPANASAFAKMNNEAGLVFDDVSGALLAVGDLIGDKYPFVAIALTNFVASDTWKMATETSRLMGPHTAFAVLQDLEHPFVMPKDGYFTSICARYSVVNIFGPMDSSLPFLALKRAFESDPSWISYEKDGVKYLVHNGNFLGKDLSMFVRPTFAFDERNNVLVFASLSSAAEEVMAAGLKGENRLVDTDTFYDVAGFTAGEELPAHNTFYYIAPQNDEILGCTLRRILGAYLPESYAMLLDRPSLKEYWGAAYGVRVGDAYRLYIHAGAKGHTLFTAAAQALLKTAAESLRVRYPYDWTETKILRSADWTERVEPTGETNVYAVSYYLSRDEYYVTIMQKADSDNVYEFVDSKIACVMSRNCIFTSVKGDWTSAAAERSFFRLFFFDETVDPGGYKGGVVMEFDATEQTFPAGEKVEQKLRLWPTDSKITEVTGLPSGMSLKKTKDGYILTGTPTKVGEDCEVWLTATCVGRLMSERWYHFVISNYASDYAQLEAGYNLTAGVEDSLMLTNVIGWTVSGLPAGVEFDKATGVLSGTPAAPGEYVVTFTKKINGKTEKVSTVINVDQGGGISINTEFKKRTFEFADDGSTREIYVGMNINWPIALTGLDGVDTKLTQKGLPSGLKLVKAKDGSYSIQGVAKKASPIDSKTGLIKVSRVELTGSNKYKWSGSETFDLVVKPLPAWAVGKFYGYHGSATFDIRSSVKVTVAENGKISIALNGLSRETGRSGSRTFTSKGFDGYYDETKSFVFAIEDLKIDSGKRVRYSGAVCQNQEFAKLGYDVGCFIAYVDGGDALDVEVAEMIDWSKLEFLTGKNARTLSLTNEMNPGLEGLTLKFLKNGKVKVSGSVVDPETGRSVSVSTTAQLAAETIYDSNLADEIAVASIGFVIDTKTQTYAYVPVWIRVVDGIVVEAYESDPIDQ